MSTNNIQELAFSALKTMAIGLSILQALSIYNIYKFSTIKAGVHTFTSIVENPLSEDGWRSAKFSLHGYSYQFFFYGAIGEGVKIKNMEGEAVKVTARNYLTNKYLVTGLKGQNVRIEPAQFEQFHKKQISNSLILIGVSTLIQAIFFLVVRLNRNKSKV